MSAGNYHYPVYHHHHQQPQQQPQQQQHHLDQTRQPIVYSVPLVRPQPLLRQRFNPRGAGRPVGSRTTPSNGNTVVAPLSQTLDEQVYAVIQPPPSVNRGVSKRRRPKLLEIDASGVPRAARRELPVEQMVSIPSPVGPKRGRPRKNKSVVYAHRFSCAQQAGKESTTSGYVSKEIERVQEAALQRMHIKMNLRGRRKIQIWLDNASQLEWAAVRFAVPLLDIDLRILDTDSDKRRDAISRMPNADLRVLEALKVRCENRDGAAIWSRITRLPNSTSTDDDATPTSMVVHLDRARPLLSSPVSHHISVPQPRYTTSALPQSLPPLAARLQTPNRRNKDVFRRSTSGSSSTSASVTPASVDHSQQPTQQPTQPPPPPPPPPVPHQRHPPRSHYEQTAAYRAAYNAYIAMHSKNVASAHSKPSLPRPPPPTRLTANPLRAADSIRFLNPSPPHVSSTGSYPPPPTSAIHPTQSHVHQKPHQTTHPHPRTSMSMKIMQMPVTQHHHHQPVVRHYFADEAHTRQVEAAASQSQSRSADVGGLVSRETRPAQPMYMLTQPVFQDSHGNRYMRVDTAPPRQQ